MNRQSLESWLGASRRPPLVMGILNITPDSFSDGGRYLGADTALEHAREMLEHGADILDLGAESTRPGASGVPADQQQERLLPLIQAIRSQSDVVLSVDTTSAAVAAAALSAGADVINDISAGQFDPAMLPLAAARSAPIVLMHMQGEPRTMQHNPAYGDVVQEVKAFLRQRQSAALAAGIQPHHILLDVGIGFGKTTQHNLLLLRHLREFADLGSPIVLGTSRKRFIGQTTGVEIPAQRVAGSCATVAWCLGQGASIFRVHDVAATVQTVRMITAIADA